MPTVAGSAVTARVGFVRDHELNFTALVIVDATIGGGLEVMRALHFDDQDAALGMDTYCLACAGRTHYGGVESWTIDHDVLTFRFEADAASALGVQRVLSFNVGAEGAGVARSALLELVGAGAL